LGARQQHPVLQKKPGQGPEELRSNFLSLFSFLLLQLLWTLTRTKEIRKDDEERR
jgi:hypothetical protein